MMNVFLIVIVTVFLTSSVRAQDVAPHNESIQGDEMKADLFFLASPGMRGRLTGTAENDLAAEFVRSRFERLGLAPAGTNGSFYHVYNLMTSTLGKENLLEISSDRSTRRPRVGQDFHPLRFSASGSVPASLVFAGFGITSPELNYDDYSGDAIEGSIVLVLDHEPGEFDPQSPFDGVVPTLASRHPVHKALHAQAQGAVGILYVSDVHNHPGPENFGSAARVYWPEVPPRIERYELGSWAEHVRIPAVQISRALARELIGGTGRTLEDLARSAETSRGTTPIPIPGIEIDLTAAVDRHAISDRSVSPSWKDPIRTFERNTFSSAPISITTEPMGTKCSPVRTMMLRVWSACSTSLRPTRWPRRTVDVLVDRSCLPPGTPKNVD